ncbi:MAG: cob(I)yrinic acid a,c-diamide adenosyltransferase [Candidatus Sungbacteria bacterium]|uniref:Cob(I)yrinic acid a,c-diamide adenosyltransferase n=1 Tax=Candidatus Sungiibacteriota bacterium TaxID=2750080 RepID=A0A9D6LS05_9BACT|nr:cob(I)yrinic acid a,c-diamide adenosyltransferase [Candidatus Sungbacteria bacterium]
MIIVNTGNGKGKTTAALGQALRAVGEGKKVLMIQFIKGPWKSGEDESAKLLAPNFLLRKMGRGFVGILGDSLPREAHETAAREALLMAEKETKEANWDMLILDEINNALALNLISLESVLRFIDAFPKDKHLVLTGRDADKEVIRRADLITEMKEVKHPYQAGIKGKRGIEY